jgi:hypothetical protein
MAQVTIRKTFKVDGVLTNMTSVSIGGVAVSPTSTGVYERTVTGLTGGTTYSCAIVYVYATETYTETESVPVPTDATVGVGEYTCAQLIDKIKHIAGRGATTTSGLDIDTVLLDALNEAQRKIVKRCPNLEELQVKDITTLDALTGIYSYSIAAFNPEIMFIHDVWILNGTSSFHLEYMEKDDFDLKYPDPSSITAGTPERWTRRGNTIEFNCPVSATYNGLAIRVDYTKKVTPFPTTTSTNKSDIADADDGLMMFAWSKLLRIIARDNPMLAQEKLVQFNEWLDEFEDQHDIEYEELDNG